MLNYYYVNEEILKESFNITNDLTVSHLKSIKKDNETSILNTLTNTLNKSYLSYININYPSNKNTDRKNLVVFRKYCIITYIRFVDYQYNIEQTDPNNVEYIGSISLDDNSIIHTKNLSNINDQLLFFLKKCLNDPENRIKLPAIKTLNDYKRDLIKLGFIKKIQRENYLTGKLNCSLTCGVPQSMSYFEDIFKRNRLEFIETKSVTFKINTKTKLNNLIYNLERNYKNDIIDIKCKSMNKFSYVTITYNKNGLLNHDIENKIKKLYTQL